VDVLKKNIFWIVLGVAVLGAAGFWAVAVLAKQGSVKQLRTEYESRVKDLEDAIRKAGNIRTRADIDAIGSQRQMLLDTETRVRELLEGRRDPSGVYLSRGVNVNTDPSRFNPRPNLEDVARFRQWIDVKYVELCNMAREAGTVCRIRGQNQREALKAHGRTPLDDITAENINQVLEQFVISQEVHKILSSVKVKVQGIEKDEETQEDRIREDTRGVQFIDRIEFLTDTEIQVRKGAMGTQAAAATQAAAQEPYKKQTLKIEFVAHYSVVPEVIRRLIASREFFLVITCMDIYRHPQMFGRESAGGLPTPERTAAVGEALLLQNTRDNEAPVVVKLECEVLTFQFKEEGK
jgi:hypothetical protein